MARITRIVPTARVGHERKGDTLVASTLHRATGVSPFRFTGMETPSSAARRLRRPRGWWFAASALGFDPWHPCNPWL